MKTLYLWVLSTELTACQHSGVWNFEAAPSFLVGVRVKFVQFLPNNKVFSTYLIYLCLIQ